MVLWNLIGGFMKKIFSCRRSSLALIAIVALTAIAIETSADIGGIALAISGIVGAVSGSNAWEKRSHNGK
jgi:hypothetical protein